MEKFKMLQKEIYNNLYNKKANIVTESLSAKERVFAQISHNLLEWILKGKGASSYFNTNNAKNAIEDLMKFANKSYNQAENTLLSLYDYLVYLKELVEDGKENSYEIKKAIQNIDGRFDIYDSTNIGDAMFDEIIRKIR